MKLNKKIGNYSNMFEVITRDDGTERIVTNSKATQKLKDSIYKAHGEMLPNDWIYQTYFRILESLTNYDVKSEEDLSEYQHEVVDGLVDVYTSDLTKWLNSSVYNVSYLDEAVREFGATDNILITAQYLAIDEIYGFVVDLLIG